jgi:tRNA (adenine-N(1)-)-methyltransferase non-catalytic subunit
VPGTELNADALADTNVSNGADDADDADDDAVVATADDEELTLVDESGQVVARSKREVLDDSARQTLTSAEIEELKQKGTAAGKELIAKLLLSHAAIDEKTSFSLAKYKLLKTKKYIRRFTVLPLDVNMLAHWMLEDKDAAKILELRNEAMALVGCWADVHFSAAPAEGAEGPHGGRWLVVDDTGGLLTASLAERMGILYRPDDDFEDDPMRQPGQESTSVQPESQEAKAEGESGDAKAEAQPKPVAKRPRRDDMEIHYAKNNTLTVIHPNTQPNLFLLRYFDYDFTEPNQRPPYHPLFTNIMTLSWLQLLAPEDDPSYAEDPPDVEPEVLASWKTNRRGNYHRKRRRWARTNHIVDTTRAGGFSGLAVASTMDPISIMRHAMPLLAGGAPVAIYSQNIDPLAQLADCFSVGRRAAWITSPPVEAVGKTPAELETWEGNEDFPLNPTLLLGTAVQTSRARRWQVLPGRTHPTMMDRGGSDGYVFTAWKAIPVQGKIEARGKFKKTKK